MFLFSLQTHWILAHERMRRLFFANFSSVLDRLHSGAYKRVFNRLYSLSTVQVLQQCPGETVVSVMFPLELINIREDMYIIKVIIFIK